MLCDCHVLDTGAHCCPCSSTHPRARALTGSKSLHFQISEGSKTGSPGGCSTGDLCSAERPVWGWVEACESPLWSCTLVVRASGWILLLAQAKWRSMCGCDCNCCANHSVCSLVFVSCFLQQKGPRLTYSTYHNPTGWTVPLRFITWGCRQLATSAVLVASPFHPPFHSHSHSSHPSHIPASHHPSLVCRKTLA